MVLPTGCATRLKQTSNDSKQRVGDVIEVGCCKETNDPRSHNLSERDNPFLKTLCACQFLLTLDYGKKSGNASNDDAQKWWSPPGIVCEPIVPTPTVMRTQGTRWARRRGTTLGHFRKRKDLD